MPTFSIVNDLGLFLGIIEPDVDNVSVFVSYGDGIALPARIPSYLVEEALQTVPKRVVISDRNGNRTMFLEGRNVYFGTGSDTNFTLDPSRGERRKALKEDVAKGARVVDYLSDIDFCMSLYDTSNIIICSNSFVST